MGDVNRILITGAAGFIGRAAVADARGRGIDVVAVVRGRAPKVWAKDAGITVCTCDLSDPDTSALADAMQGVDAVIHAAAHMGGDADQHDGDTVKATQTVLNAMAVAQVKRLVLVSSISVYDTMALPIGATLTEDCPLENPAQARDAYVRAKLLQEDLCLRAARDQRLTLWRLRPGAVFGPRRLWNAHLGVRIGPVLAARGRLWAGAAVPRRRAARWALVQAALTDGGGVLNILDEDLPDRSALSARLAANRLAPAGDTAALAGADAVAGTGPAQPAGAAARAGAARADDAAALFQQGLRKALGGVRPALRGPDEHRNRGERI